MPTVGDCFILSALGLSHGVAPAGRSVQIPRVNHLAASPTVFVTLVTDLRSPKGFFISNPRVGSNTSWDFLSLIIDLLQTNVR